MKIPRTFSPSLRQCSVYLGVFCLFNTGSHQGALAQTSQNPAVATTAVTSLPEEAQPQRPEDEATLKNTPRHILGDQKAIWTSPLKLRTHDLVWLVPLAGALGAGIATDHHTMGSVVSHDPGFNQANVNASNVLTGGVLAAPAALYGFGLWKQNEHARETGLLGAEAIGDGLVVEQALKLVFWRERPFQDNARGLFFQGGAGTDSSFPSSHSVLVWSSAAVIAGEYHSPWTQLGVYSLATGVSLSRVMGQQHFPSDVLVGSAGGWLIGHYVYKAHHRAGLLPKMLTSHGSPTLTQVP